MNFLKKYLHKKNLINILFFGVVLLVLGPMLLPGYILTLDMAWSTELGFRWVADGFNNSLPLYALFYTLGTIFPSWVVQKLMLIALFFLLLYVPYRFIPFVELHAARVFAGLVYALNPFVYSRMLAGQWGVLLGYALLPLLLYGLVKFVEKPDRKTSLCLAGALLLVGSVSIHFLYIGILISLVWLGVHMCDFVVSKNYSQLRLLLRFSLLAGVVFVVVSTYWLVPALLRESPLEARFDTAHFEGFSASSNDVVPTPLNLAVLGGFWAEDMEWRYYFVWPQDSYLFWFSAVVLFVFIAFGFAALLRDTSTRFRTLLLLGIDIISSVLAFGAWGGMFSSLNLWLYMHMPGWTGLRDSHKVIGVLGLVYALLAGVGFGKLLQYIQEGKKHFTFVIPVLFMVPVLFGMHRWNGFHGQLEPVWYPDSWFEARALVEQSSEEEKVLVLPWRGYFSLSFANQLIVSNPAPEFFGTDRVYAGKSVEVGEVYDQETDPVYRELDTLLQTAITLSPEALLSAYRAHNVRYILVIDNNAVEDKNSWYIPPVGTESAQNMTDDGDILDTLLSVPNTQLLEGEINLFYIK